MGWFRSRGRLRAAFEDHERHQIPEMAAYNDDWIVKRRWENYQKYAKKHPAIAEVVRVSISRTLDSNELVVELYGVDGKVASLWCAEYDGGAVRSVTTY